MLNFCPGLKAVGKLNLLANLAKNNSKKFYQTLAISPTISLTAKSATIPLWSSLTPSVL